MSPDRQQVAAKLREDHAYMLDLMQRITAMCTRRDDAEDCAGCPSLQRSVCNGNIEQLVRTFIDVTLRHNLVESAYMAELVPAEHRIAHNRAHIEIAEQLKSVRIEYSRSGNGLAAVEATERILEAIRAHLSDFDQALEDYLLAAA